MKKLLLLPTVLFVMLIAAMVNPFGCREKKTQSNFGKSAILDSVIVDSAVFGHGGDLYEAIYNRDSITAQDVFSCPPRVVLIIDGKVMPIVGDTITVSMCKSGCRDEPTLCEKRLSSVTMERDSLQRELNNIKAKQAEYRFSSTLPLGSKTPFIMGGETEGSFDSDSIMTTWNGQLSSPTSDTLLLRNRVTGEFDIKIHRKDLPKNK